jgi:hypothetical protein
MALLAEFDRAKALLRRGAAAEAAALLEDLVQRNRATFPSSRSWPKRTARWAGGRRPWSLKRAAQLNPALDFLRLRIAEGRSSWAVWPTRAPSTKRCWPWTALGEGLDGSG